jgi:hypothetical protein
MVDSTIANICKIILISIYHTYFHGIPLFFIIQSILLCLSPIKRAYFSFYYPIIRISDLYFIYNFDKSVYPWPSIEKIILNENNIKFSIKNKKLDKEKSETIKYIKEKEKLIKEIIKFSKKYDIPLEYAKS